MSLKEKWKSECTDTGAFLKTKLGPILGLLGLIGALGEYLQMLPQVISDVVPMWLKLTILFSGLIAHLYGGLTVKKQDGQV